jgi:hypothetical protein
MTVTIRTYGEHSPGLEAQAVPSSGIAPELININSLTSTQGSASSIVDGQTIDFTFTGKFDLSPLGGVLPKTIADLAPFQILANITSFTIGSGGQAFFSETYTPAVTFSQVGDFLDKGPAMVADLAGNDVYYSSTDAINNPDSVYLYAGNDTYYENHHLLTHTDHFYGGDGIDTAVINLKSTSVTIKPINNMWNYVTQKSELPGFEITDNTKTTNTLDVNQVERLHFTDYNIALDIGKNQVAGECYLLYKAAFNRKPDEGGLGYWINGLDNGADLINGVAQSFVNSKEFNDLYGANISNTAFASLLYTNVLHRPLDQGGYDFWVTALYNGVSRANVLENFASSKENVDQVASLIANGIQYTPA